MSGSRVQRPPLPALTFRGWALLTGAIAAVVVAYITGWRELLFIGCALGAVVLVAVLLVMARSQRIGVVRTLSASTVPAGQTVGVTLELTNSTPYPITGLEWADVVPAELGAASGGRLPALSARGYTGSRTRLRYALTAARRGTVRIGPLALRATDPFGLCRYDGTIGPVERLVVLPEVTALDGGVTAGGGSAEAALRAALTGRGQDDVIAREYRQGDALRHVHWRATAHRGELMVRQEQQEDEAVAVVLLDNREEAWRSTAAFEWAVSFAASVVVHLSAGATGVELVLTAPLDDTSASKDRPLDEVLLDLATVSRRPARPGSGGAFSRDLDRLIGESGAPLIAVMGSTSEGEWRDISARRGARSSGVGVFVGSTALPEQVWAQGWRIIEVDDASSDKAAVWRRASNGSARV